MDYLKIHIDFQLQGNSFTSISELLAFSKANFPDLYVFLLEWFNSQKDLEINTSGSTGTPKTIKLKKAHMIASSKATGDFFNLEAKTTALLCMNPNFIGGKMMVVRALQLGWHLDVETASNHLLQNSDKKYDFSAMVPSQIHNSFEKIHCFKKIIVGGGEISEVLLDKIQHIKTELYATYGMTETCSHIAIRKLNNFSNKEEHKRIKSAYETLANISISIDEKRCLVIDAPTISDERILTNDIVELINDRSFKWLGRYDSIINSGGIKLQPEIIEKKLSKIIKKRFFVAGLPDAVLGEKLVLVIEGSKLKNVSDEINKLNSLSKFEKPKEIYFMDQFIETETAKINRKATIKRIKYTY